MARKRTTSGKAKTSRKVKRRASSATKYVCPNPGSPLGLRAIVTKIRTDDVFAKFIAKQLCKAHNGDMEAVRCVNSYFKPTDAELGAICIPESKRAALCLCTDNNFMLLIDVVAHGVDETRKG